jgi:putative spermidine/putrescine transport system ATP-binding protein
VVYLGSVNHYLVELDAGPTLTVLSQNLHGSTDQAMSRRGQDVTVGWADEHVIDLSDPGHPQHPQQKEQS